MRARPAELFMREMHKWKDKVEFSLDNRQIFFLFFGLSVVGCFVFALGVMTGRRVDWDTTAEVATLADDSLDQLAAEIGGAGDEFAFKAGLRESTAPELAATRDPGIAPRDKDELAELAAAAAGQTGATSKAAGEASASASGSAKSGATKPNRKRAKTHAKATAKKAAAKSRAGKTAKAAGHSKVLASGNKSAAEQQAAKSPAGARRFTLQMKAFSQKADAEQFAAKLRRNGHDIRIEKHEVRGRQWHRVRLGSFATWDEALAAKGDFEAAEHVIAYVVSQ
ncbi:MAG: SPOR domain-containing protein [Myxococcales bacterium FL481]|nr:MAG: SPOR domain-containing protein [Myxococcales bacterium FL481]